MVELGAAIRGAEDRAVVIDRAWPQALMVDAVLARSLEPCAADQLQSKCGDDCGWGWAWLQLKRPGTPLFPVLC